MLPFVAVFTLAATLVGPGYKLIGQKEGVDVYAKESAKTELAAVGELDAAPAAVQAALLDYGHHPGLIKHLSQSRIVEQHTGSMTVYEYLKLPVVKDRDYALHVTWSPSDARGIAFSLDPNAEQHVNKKVVHMTTMTGRWELEPIDGGRRTRATYHVEIDFGGNVASSSVKSGAAKDLPDVFVGMRKLAASH